MQRVEHSLDLQGNAYHLFQAAILLDRMVRDRTRELEQALEAVASSNRELNEAAVVSMTTQNRLQDAIDSISEGFAIFDPEDRLILFNRRFTDFWPGLGAGDPHRRHLPGPDPPRAWSAAASSRRTGRAPRNGSRTGRGSARARAGTAPTAGSMRNPAAAGCR